jgi:dTDP-L-rhamnose 4-epimerase
VKHNLLITGGAGFIGTHLARLALAIGHRVRILDNLSPQIHGDPPAYVPPAGSEF